MDILSAPAPTAALEPDSSAGAAPERVARGAGSILRHAGGSPADTETSNERSPLRETAEFLRTLPLFSGLGEEDLARLARSAVCRTIPEGATAMCEGDRADGLYIVRRGELEVSRREGERQVVLGVALPGAFVGEMALVDDTPRSATARALVETDLVIIGPAEFRGLLQAAPDAALTVLRTILHRLRDTESSLQQHARLASLGTLAAGLAHELNNPASAILRTAAHLQTALESWESTALRLGGEGLAIPAEAFSVPAEGDRGPREDAGDRDGRRPHRPLALEESRLIDWLEDRGVAALDAADSLLAAGWTTDRLARLVEGRSLDDTVVLVEWLASRVHSTALVAEISVAARALVDIVRAVRTYSHVGEARVQPVDVKESIDNTLIILRSRLKSGVEVITEIDRPLPCVQGNGGELSQLWTNLIDNAIDAMDGRGRLELRAFEGDGTVVVQIVDDGPGIPSEDRHCIFDPFFTTKPQGDGSGLGLHIARNIVRKHRGTISVDSAPGRTTFEVALPACSAAGGAGGGA
jgi:signal transduction histidine kinase